MTILGISRRTWRGLSVLFGGVLVHLSFGTLYTFGNLNPYLTSYMRWHGSDPDLQYIDCAWVFATATMGQASTMFMGGILERRLGPRITCLLGGWFMSLGVMLTYFSVQHSFALTVLTYGVMFGVGIGFGYAIPLGCAMKWFPNRKGLANGVVVAGFGGGAFIFNQVQTAFINPDNLKLGRGSPGETDEEGYFHDPEMLQRVPHVFLLLGGCYAGMQLFGSLLLCHPSEEYVKDSPSTMAEEMERVELIHSQRGNGAAPLMDCMSISPSKSEAGGADDEFSTHPLEMLKSPRFYCLWFMMFCNGQGSIFVAALYKAYGQTFISDDTFLALVGAFAAIFNGLGRIFWGVIADKISFRVSMLLMTAAFTCLMLTFNLTSLGDKAYFFAYVCLLFGCFSGTFSLFPTASAKCFGPKYLGINYGLLFSSLFVTSLLCTFLSQTFKSLIGWEGLFFLIAGFSFISFVLAMCFKAKDRNGKEI